MFVLVLVTLALQAACAYADPSQLTSVTVAPSSQVAGAHSDVEIAIRQATGFLPPSQTADGSSDDPFPLELAKQITVALPPGLLANPTSFPTCDDTAVYSSGLTCPPASQVGVLTLLEPGQTYDPNTGAYSKYLTIPFPIINETPQPGQVARFGVPIVPGQAAINIGVAVRDTSDYGVTATVTNIPSAITFFEADIDLWGVPGASSHDSERIACETPGGGGFTAGCTSPITDASPFMVNPTVCGAPSTATATLQTYDEPTTLFSANASIPPFTGCSALPFAPSLSFASSSGAVGQPDAFSAGLSVPQAAANDPSTDTTTNVQSVTLALPAGVALSPGVASGLGACTDAQFGQGSDAPEACPNISQIGSATIVTPLLAQPLTGELFVGQQESSDPTSGQMYRIFLDAVGQGTDVKLVGHVSANPSTGQLTATFAQNPQVPFSSLQLSFKGGPRAPLANPPICGTATSNWSISSYANPGAPVTGSSSFPVTGNCGLASQFTPSLSAGTASNQAGASSPFSFTLTRPDGQQVLSGIPTISLPAGLNADIASATECPSAQAAVAQCSAASQVGVASVSAGPGPQPFQLTGQPVYLTGPYEGAPFGLAEVITAVAGPYDLGQVVVRQALDVDPTTAAVTIHSDPLPTILGGVPLDLQSLSVDINRPGFMRSPTSCDPMSIGATVQGAALGVPATVAPGYVGYAPGPSSTVDLTQPFQMGGCANLHFAPRLGIVLSGKGRTRTDSHPRLTATLTQPAGQANLHAVKVALPLSLALDPNNSQHVCSVADAAKIACPKRTIVGSATADTRILPHPLGGSVYLVQGIRKGPHGTSIRTLPHLLIPLRGQDGVAINLAGRTEVNGAEQLVTDFPSIPDAAISRFVLRITGGKRGILVVTGGRDLCRGPQIGTAEEAGQNGRLSDANLRLRTPACPARHRGARPSGR